jgi:hypothetical protein
MDRRSFLTGSLALGGAVLVPVRFAAAQATPDASPIDTEYPALTLTLADDGFTIDSTFAAGRYAVTVVNTGTSEQSGAAHTVVARLPEGVSSDDFEAVMTTSAGDTFDFNTLHGLGFPDWPAPNGGAVHGIADLLPGDHVVFDPFDTRGHVFFTVTGETPDAPVPTADFEFTIGEMVINLPKEALTSTPALWHIENKGALIHELAVLATPADFTFDDFMAMMMLPEDATPTPDMKVIEYQPVVAIGLLGSGAQSWLHATLEAGHYMAVCMFPDDQGMPHAMSGMYAFFDIA